MINALEDHKGTVRLEGRKITNLRFGVHMMASTTRNLQPLWWIAYTRPLLPLAWKLAERSRNWWPTTQMGSALIPRSTAKKLNECDSFKDQGAVVTVQGSNLTYGPELRRQQQHWRNWRPSRIKRKNISLSLKIRPMQHSCTPAKPGHWQQPSRRTFQATEIRCSRKLLVISYKGQIINDAVRGIQASHRA